MSYAFVVRALRNRLAERDDKLTDAEETVLAALKSEREGELVVGGPDRTHLPFRSMTARFITLILSQGDDRPFNRLRFRSLDIQGTLQLDAVDLRVRLYIEDCSLDGLNLDQSTLPELVLDRATLGKLSATQCEILGGIRCKSACRIQEVFIVGSRIHGNLDLRGVHVGGSQRVAVHASGLSVGGNALVCCPARLDGELRIAQATIRGNLDLSGAWIGRAGGTAVGGQYIQVEGDVLMGQRLAALGETEEQPTVCRGRVDLGGARIGGNLRAHGARLLAAHVWTPDGSLDDAQPDTVHALTTAGIAEISGHDYALSLEGAEIVGSAHINQGLLALGSVVLKHLRLGRDLFVNDAAILVSSRYAIDANGARIRGSVDLRRADASTDEWTFVDGVISFDHAVVEGSFSADRTVFLMPRARDGDGGEPYSDPLPTIELPALLAEETDASKLPAPFKAKPMHVGLNLRYAEIGRSLRLPESPIETLADEVMTLPEGDKHRALWNKARRKIDRAPWAGRPPQDYKLNLENVRCARFVDDIRRWPAGLRSALFNDFDYGSLVNQAVGTTYSGVFLATLRNYTQQSAASDARQGRRQWFRPQPYVHLLRFYESAGQRSAMASVGEQLGRQALRHRGGIMKTVGHILWFTGYGYRPGRAVWGILFLWIFATIVFSAAYDSGLILVRPHQLVERALEEQQMLEVGNRANRDTVIVFHTGGQMRWAHTSSIARPRPALQLEQINVPGIPPFLSAIYALDLVLPVVDLGMASVYGPGVYQWSSDEKRLCLRAPCWRWTLVTGLHAVVWLASLLGWTLGTLLVAALAGVLRR